MMKYTPCQLEAAREAHRKAKGLLQKSRRIKGAGRQSVVAWAYEQVRSTARDVQKIEIAFALHDSEGE